MLVPKLRFKREDGTDYPEWETHIIGDYLSESKVIGSNGKTAKKLTVKLWAKGVVEKNAAFEGSEQTQYYIRRAGQLMYGKLDFLNCAFGIIPQELDGYESTLDSPAFDIHGINGTFLLSRIIQKSFYKKNGDTANGSRKAKRIHPEVFLHMEISIPCLEEQQKIADFLSTIDEVIAQSESEVANLEQQKKAAMQKIFSQEVRFRREDGTEYPEWEDCILSDYCKELKSSIDPKKYPQDSFLEYSMPAFDMDKKPSSVIGNDMNSNRKIVNCPCVLINKLNVRKKRIWKIVNPTNNSVCSAEFIPVTSDKMSIDFLEHLALSDRFTARLLDCSTGTSNSQKRVTPDIIMDMPVSIPCLEEQQKIADFLSAYDEAISYAKQELDKWKELKKGLLQQMFV